MKRNIFIIIIFVLVFSVLMLSGCYCGDREKNCRGLCENEFVWSLTHNKINIMDYYDVTIEQFKSIGGNATDGYVGATVKTSEKMNLPPYVSRSQLKLKVYDDGFLVGEALLRNNGKISEWPLKINVSEYVRGDYTFEIEYYEGWVIKPACDCEK